MNDNERHIQRITLRPLKRSDGIIAFTALVMLSVMVVVALAASEEMTLESKAAQNRNSIRQAYQAAYSGIDYCLYLSTLYADWRTRYGGGNWIANYTVGTGKVTVSAADPTDGSIAGNPIHTVAFTAASSSGLAKRSLTARGTPPPGQTLRYVLCSLTNADMELRQGVSVYGDVRTRGNINADSNVSLAGNIYTATGAAVTASLVDADTQVIRTDRALATPPVSLSWFQSAAKELSLPSSFGHYLIDKALLTPTNNPFGLTQPDGLYYFDAHGFEVWIGDSYINATLIIANSSRVLIRHGCYLKTFSSQYPALLSTGDIAFEIERNLKESIADVDFNGNGNKTDTFVSQICGVIYSATKVTGFQKNSDPGPFYVRGAVVSNEIRITTGASFYVYYDPGLAETAVAGFQGPGLVLSAGSLRE